MKSGFKIVTLAIGMTLLPSVSQAGTVNCDAPGVDLQKKIDNAEIGEELFISGTCDGPFLIKKDLIITGAPHAFLRDPSGSHSVLAMVRSQGILRNLIVNADGNTVGIQIGQGSSATLSNITVEDAAAVGINVVESSFATVHANSQLRNNGNSGIQVLLASSALIFGNVIENNGTGIIVSQMATAQIFDNEIINNTNAGLDIGFTYGVLTVFDPTNTIQGNGAAGSEVDVLCHARGSIQMGPTPFISNTKGQVINAGCQIVNGPLF